MTIGFAVIVVWSARSYGRTVGFAFGINWLLTGWAISMIRATQGPEAGHLLIFFVTLALTLRASVFSWWDTVAWLLLFNLLHNLYPVLSLRQVRARLTPARKNGLTMQ
jgi:hypothetical protein